MSFIPFSSHHNLTAYRFYFAKTNYTPALNFPVTPDSLTTTIKNQNETATLINEGEINILKKAGLTEVSFTARLPRRSQPYVVGTLYTVQHYLSILETLKSNKVPFVFHVTRYMRNKNGVSGQFEATSLKCSLEEYTIKEDAENGDDVLVEITLKQYVPYLSNRKKINADGTVTAVVNSTKTVSSSSTKLPNSYTVRSGDWLTTISKKYYGTTSSWKKIYSANKKTIESVARNHGRKSSADGHWIYAGTKLTIPK